MKLKKIALGSLVGVAMTAALAVPGVSNAFWGHGCNTGCNVVRYTCNPCNTCNPCRTYNRVVTTKVCNSCGYCKIYRTRYTGYVSGYWGGGYFGYGYY